jgi:hypothetical protein
MYISRVGRRCCDPGSLFLSIFSINFPFRLDFRPFDIYIRYLAHALSVQYGRVIIVSFL